MTARSQATPEGAGRVKKGFAPISGFRVRVRGPARRRSLRARSAHRLDRSVLRSTSPLPPCAGGPRHSSQDIAIVVSEMVTNALRHALSGPGDTGPRRTGSRLVPPAREYESGNGQGHAPSPRYTAPLPRHHWAGGPGAGTPAGRGARPSLRDVLARRGDLRGGHHRGIPGMAPGSPSCGRGRIRRGGRAGRRQGAGVLVTAMPRFRCRRRHHRGDAAEPRGNPSSTGHMWITIWRRYRRDPLPALLANPGCQRHLSW